MDALVGSLAAAGVRTSLTWSLVTPPAQMSEEVSALALCTWTGNDAWDQVVPLKWAMYPPCGSPAGAPNAQASLADVVTAALMSPGRRVGCAQPAPVQCAAIA
jgi:hypothetical protein